MKKTVYLAILSAGFGLIAAQAADVDCLKVSLGVKQSVVADQSKVLEIVSSSVSSSPSCACEIVKSAIESSKANAEAVAAIVEAAATAAPEQLRLVSQCAVAMAPDSLDKVQAVMAKLDPNRGDSAPSSKDAKSSKAPAQSEVADETNPLNFPGQGPVGPTPGGKGGFTVYPFVPPVLIDFPEVTEVDPRPIR